MITETVYVLVVRPKHIPSQFSFCYHTAKAALINLILPLCSLI